MKKPIQISIPQPCHEKWADMTPVEKGRFCASCQKTIIDFTTLSDRQILLAAKSGEDICARAHNSQLNRNLVVPKEKSSLWAAASAAVLSFLTISCGGTLTNNSINTEQTDSKTDDIKTDNSQEDYRMLSGIVNDITGPIPQASIRNTVTGETVTSDLDGKYIIKAKEGDIIEYSFIGYDTVTVTVTKSELPDVKLMDGAGVLGEVVIEKRYPWTTEIIKRRNR